MNETEPKEAVRKQDPQTSILPGSVSEQLRKAGLQFDYEMPNDTKDYLGAFLETSVNLDKNRTEGLKNKMHYSVQRMESMKKDLKFSRRREDRGANILNSRRRRRFTREEQQRYGMALFQKHDLKFADVIPLYKLWKDYAVKVLAPKHMTAHNTRTAGAHLVRMELIGCFMWVHGSSCKSFVGIAGIIVKETMYTFQVVTKENEVKSLPKMVSEFRFDLKGHVFTLYGSEMHQRSVDRSVRKFNPQLTKHMHKTKSTIPVHSRT